MYSTLLHEPSFQRPSAKINCCSLNCSNVNSFSSNDSDSSGAENSAPANGYSFPSYAINIVGYSNPPTIPHHIIHYPSYIIHHLYHPLYPTKNIPQKPRRRTEATCHICDILSYFFGRGQYMRCSVVLCKRGVAGKNSRDGSQLGRLRRIYEKRYDKRGLQCILGCARGIRLQV